MRAIVRRLVTIVPTLLLFVSLLGVLVENAELREQLIDALVDRLQPIAGPCFGACTST